MSAHRWPSAFYFRSEKEFALCRRDQIAMGVISAVLIHKGGDPNPDELAQDVVDYTDALINRLDATRREKE